MPRYDENVEPWLFKLLVYDIVRLVFVPLPALKMFTMIYIFLVDWEYSE